MEQQLTVSIIMPAYNCMDTIRASAMSALCQTAGTLELIIVDDCSTDGTIEIIMELASSDPRVKILQNESNRGVAASRNRAINVASGELIAFFDSDDLWEPDKLAKQISLMQETDRDLCYTSYDYVDKGGIPIYRPYIVPETIDYDGLLKENVIGLSSVVLRKDVLGELRFDESLFHEDLALWLKLLRAGTAAQGLSEVLTHNRIGGRSHDKWKALMNRWRVYRKSEELSAVRSCWYLAHYILAGLIKYKKR